MESMESNKAFRVRFEEPAETSGRSWIENYLKPAIIMLVDYRRKNKATPTSNFKFYREIYGGAFYSVIFQRVNVPEILEPAWERILDEG